MKWEPYLGNKSYRDITLKIITIRIMNFIIHSLKIKKNDENYILRHEEKASVLLMRHG